MRRLVREGEDDKGGFGKTEVLSRFMSTAA